MWRYRWSVEYEERLQELQEKHRDSVAYVLGKLKVVMEALQNGGKLQNIRYKFLRHERDGVYAVRCSARGMRPIRLYIYESPRTIHLLTIGDKNTQNDDIAWCAATANDIKAGNYGSEPSHEPPGDAGEGGGQSRTD